MPPDSPLLLSLSLMDRILVHAVCGIAPQAFSYPAWRTKHLQNQVFYYTPPYYDYAVVKPHGEEKIRVSEWPTLTAEEPQQYIMVHIPAGQKHMAEVAQYGTSPGRLLRDQLKRCYGAQDYQVFHVFHPQRKIMGTWKKLCDKPDEYTLLIKRDAYKKLAMAALEKLVDVCERTKLLDQSSLSDVAGAIIRNAGFSSDEIRHLMSMANAKEGYELSAVLRDMGKELYPQGGFAGRVTARSNPDQPGHARG